MSLWKALWADENGFVVTAEAALLATVGVIGATVGVKMAATSVNAELTEVAESLRSLDQSYSVNGHASCNAWIAGSRYEQQSVERSLDQLHEMKGDEFRRREREEAEREETDRRRDDSRRGRPEFRPRRPEGRDAFRPRKRKDERHPTPRRRAETSDKRPVETSA